MRGLHDTTTVNGLARDQALHLTQAPSLARHLALGGLLLALSMGANAHGIAGNRFFPGTMNFDDPAVADEFSITSGTQQQPLGAQDVRDDATTISFARLLTPKISIGFDTGLLKRNWSGAQTFGTTGTDLVLKGRLYENDLNETLVASSLIYTLPGSGASRLAANGPSVIAPSLYVGQGLGALPEAFSWLRPLGFTAGLSVGFPTSKDATNLSYDPALNQFSPYTQKNVTTIHSGFAIEYSTLYLTDRFTPGVLPKDEPLHQWVPLVEFAFDSPQGQRTRATANPGISYVKDVWQLAAEAVVPLNHATGHGVGVNLSVLFFLDDLIPSLFGKPMLSR